MKRRDLLALSVLAWMPAMARGQDAGAEYADFLRSRKYGVVVRPFEMLALDDAVYLNMYEASGARRGLGRRIRERLGERLSPFVPEMKVALLDRLRALELPASDVSFNPDAGLFSSPYGSKEPCYLDCQPFLSFVMLRDKTIMPGAGIASRLMSPSAGQLDHYSAGIGIVLMEPSAEYVRIGYPRARFPSFAAIEMDPEKPAEALVSLARPLGLAFAELFVAQTAKNRTS